MGMFQLYSPCCNWFLKIHTDCHEVDNLIINLFGGIVVPYEPKKDKLEILDVMVMKCSSGYEMSGKGNIYKIKDLNGVGFYLYEVIDKLVEGNMDEQYCVFHGGVVAKDGVAYCIMAPTMTGKSTFVTYFALNGYDYLADDYIFVDRKERTIEPLPLPVSLRDATVLGPRLNNVFSVSGYNELKGEYNVLASLYSGKKVLYRLNNVFFIERAGCNNLQLMGKGELCKELLFNMKNAIDLERERLTVNELVDSVGGYKLTYKELEYAVKNLTFV